jgi:predicted PurR-regulated permease PerM
LVSIVLAPTLVMLNRVGVQAYELSQDVIPWVEQKFDSPQDLELRLPAWIPFRDEIRKSGPQIANKLGELAGKAGGFLVEGLSAATMGTANFFLQLFVMVYAMFYFLREGPATAKRVIGYAPLPHRVRVLLVETGMSVTRATLKGTLVIGLVQGALGGVAFAVAGIQGAAFWGAVMALSSVIPAVGTAIVWVPATIFLFVTGDVGTGVGLLLWCTIVVGGVDNILRPILVGGDTQMPDILILVSTFGGLTFFGVAGLIIGPVIAALFVTMWQVQRVTLQGEFSEEEAEAVQV